MKTAVVVGFAVLALVFGGCTKSKPAAPPRGEEARETMHRGGIEAATAMPAGHPEIGEATRRLPAGHPPMAGTARSESASAGSARALPPGHPPMAGGARSAGGEAAEEGHEGHDHDAPDEKLPPVVIDGTKGDAAAGKLLFAKLCARCHGESGAGGGMMAAGDLTDKAWQARMTDQKIGVTISHGKPNTKMPSFAEDMNLQKLNDLVAHIRTLKKR